MMLNPDEIEAADQRARRMVFEAARRRYRRTHGTHKSAKASDHSNLRRAIEKATRKAQRRSKR